MSKRLGIFLGITLFSLLAHAQWNEKDSLNLGRILNTAGKQVIADEKPAWNVDVTLPKVFPEKREIRLSLRPYTANTKYNYDPIYQKRINIMGDTWKYGEGFRIPIAVIYSNWAGTPFDPGIRKSREEIEATGLRYNPLARRANNMATGAWVSASGGGQTVDLMAPFTKDFWDRKGRKRRARTLEVLQSYGD
jgi:hypothetical protein